jgi:hypothetical protein
MPGSGAPLRAGRAMGTARMNVNSSGPRGGARRRRVGALPRGVGLALAAALVCGPAAGQPRRDADGALRPLPDPPRASRSAGPHPDWLAGPDGPILPPQTFQPRGLAPSTVAPSAGGADGPCKQPVTPLCPRDKETYRGEAARKACEALVSMHVQEVFAYRECLETEATRATRAVNEAIRLLKCRRPTLKGCD